MPKFVTRTIRLVAGALVLAVAIAPSVECFASAQMTPARHACCAAMNGECDVAVTASCCPTDTDSLVFISTKQTVDFNPVAVLVAILSMPAIADSLEWRTVAPAETSASGPPGVPTYLYISSFRI